MPQFRLVSRQDVTDEIMAAAYCTSMVGSLPSDSDITAGISSAPGQPTQIKKSMRLHNSLKPGHEYIARDYCGVSNYGTQTPKLRGIGMRVDGVSARVAHRFTGIKHVARLLRSSSITGLKFFEHGTTHTLQTTTSFGRRRYFCGSE